MLVKENHYQTIWISQEDENTVHIINQQLLPFAFEIMDLHSVFDTFLAIKEMYVRGAPLIGVTGAVGVYLFLKNEIDSKSYDFQKVKETGEYLKTARPTAVNLAFAIDEILNAVHFANDYNEAVEIAKKTTENLINKEVEYSYNIGKAGLKLIEEISIRKKGEVVNILTHCNAGWLACIDYGTATAPIYLAYEKGIKLHIWVDETRPRNQGARLTAWELQQQGVPCTIITDNAGGHLMQHEMVDMVIVGSDRTTVNGDVANKIGTYLKALAAKHNNIPFYVALPSSTIDWNMEDGVANIPIEKRDASEISRIEGVNSEGQMDTLYIMPEGSSFLNYGFDVTPAELVTGLITEKGICKASKEGIRSLFPEKFKK